MKTKGVDERPTIRFHFTLVSHSTSAHLNFFFLNLIEIIKIIIIIIIS